MRVIFHAQKFDELRIWPEGKELEAVIVSGRQWVEEVLSSNSIPHFPLTPATVDMSDRSWKSMRRLWRSSWM